MKSSSHNVHTSKPTSSFFTGRMPFLTTNEQCQSTEGNLKAHQPMIIKPANCDLITEVISGIAGLLP